MEISFHSHLNSNTVIPTKLCTWHDSCAVVACAKICCDLMASNGITARWSCHRIWIAGKKSLVKRAPGPILKMIYGLITHFITIYLYITWKIVIQSSNNFTDATTVKLSWRVQICDFITSLESKLEQKEFSKDFNYEVNKHLWNGSHRTISCSHELP